VHTADERVVSGIAVILALALGAAAPPSIHWRQPLHVTQVVDLTPVRSDGRMVVAANGRLALMRPSAMQPRAFAPGYSTAVGPEPYIALSRGHAVPGAGCRFPRDSVYALDPSGVPGVIGISARGHVRRLDTLTGPGLLNGIAFDNTGRFGHRLLVTRVNAGATTVFAIDCRGRARTITRNAPVAEGGIAVAPASFGRFAGQVIAPDELSGRIFAIAPNGRATLIAKPPIPAGQDTGVESAGFAPPGFGPRWTAFLADRATPNNPHPGDDAILALSGRALVRAGVRAGDLVVASEGGANTVRVRCRRTCSVKRIATGPAVAHAEGHIVFARR
jgi:hypothetical protein